jgi:hypothetical protein
MSVGLGRTGPVVTGKQYGSHASTHSGSRSDECRRYSSSANPSVHFSVSSPRNGQCDMRALIAETYALPGGVSVAVAIGMASVGKSHVVVKFKALVAVSGAGVQV